MDFDLEEAMKRFPLPEEIADDLMNRGQIATSLGVSEPIVTKYLDQGMPVVSRGSNGQAYEFRPSECFAWKMHRDDGLRVKRAAGDLAASQMAMLFRNDDEAEDDGAPVMSAEQIIKESQADYQRNRAAELRGELVRAVRVREAYENMLIAVRTQIVSLVDFAEMEFGLNPDQVRRMQIRCDGALVQMRHELTKVCPGEVAELKPHDPLATIAVDAESA